MIILKITADDRAAISLVSSAVNDSFRLLSDSEIKIAISALLSLDRNDGAQLMAAFNCGGLRGLCGLASFRPEPFGVVDTVTGEMRPHVLKRLNTVAFWKRFGIGTALIREICKLYPSLPQYTKSKPEAWPWVEAMGMTPGETLEDGRRVYRWTAKQVSVFASAKERKP